MWLALRAFSFMFHAASEAESTPQLKQVQLTDVGRQNGNLQYI